MLPKKNVLLLLLCISLTSLLTGCFGMTTDPSKGGLFAYNPDAYEERLAEREARLAEIEAQQQQYKSESMKLAHANQEKARVLAAQKEELRHMENQANEMKARLKSAKASNKAGEAELAKLRQRASSLDTKIQKVEKNTDTAARKAELEKLHKEYNSLQQDMDALLLE